MQTYNFGNFSGEYDVTDVSFMERYENAVEAYDEGVNNIPKAGKTSEQFRYMCGVFFKFFDTVLGDGASKAMFCGKMSVSECIAAFNAVVAMVQTQGESMKAEAEKIKSKGNRAQRRAKK